MENEVVNDHCLLRSTYTYEEGMNQLNQWLMQETFEGNFLFVLSKCEFIYLLTYRLLQTYR